MKEDFSNSIPLDHSLKTSSRELKVLVREIYKDFRISLPKGTRSKTLKTGYYCLSALFCNLAKSWIASHGMVSVSLGHDAFANGRMGHLTCTPFKRAVDFLEELTVERPYVSPEGAPRLARRTYRLVDRFPGHFNRKTNFKEPTRLRLNMQGVIRYLIDKKLKCGKYIDQLFNGIETILDDNYISSLFNHQETKPITRTLSLFNSNLSSAGKIVLKNRNKEPVPYDMAGDAARHQNALNAINREIERSSIALFLPDASIPDLRQAIGYQGGSRIRLSGGTLPKVLAGVVQIERPILHRVFNNERWDEGGRFYGGWWQAIPKAYRPLITINARPTVEFDFKSMQPTMLYHQRGLEMDGDAYDLPGFPQANRNVAKEALLALLSAAPGQRVMTLERLDYPEGWNSLRLEEALRLRHQAIADAFRSQAGVRLQNLDARIAERIMFKTINRYGAIALPIHDSFIVDFRFADQFKGVMRQAYREVMGSGNIEIDQKQSTFDRIGAPSEQNRSALFLDLLSKTHGGDAEYFVNFIRAFRDISSEYETWLRATLSWFADQERQLKAAA